MFNFLKNVSSTELILLIVIVVLLFGSRFLVGFGKTSGETVKEMKKIKKDFTDALKDDDEPNKN